MMLLCIYKRCLTREWEELIVTKMDCPCTIRYIVCVCVCVCVTDDWERERERKREREIERERESLSRGGKKE